MKLEKAVRIIEDNNFLIIVNNKDGRPLYVSGGISDNLLTEEKNVMISHYGKSIVKKIVPNSVIGNTCAGTKIIAEYRE